MGAGGWSLMWKVGSEFPSQYHSHLLLFLRIDVGYFFLFFHTLARTALRSLAKL